MKSTPPILTATLLAVLVTLTGCVSPFTRKVTITQKYQPRYHFTKEEAIAVLNGACGAKRKVDYIFSNVDAEGITLAVFTQDTTSSATIYWMGRMDGITKTGYGSTYYENNGRCKFADINKLQLLLYSDHADVRVHMKGLTGGWLFGRFICENDPTDYDRVASALLLLCPKVE